MRNTLSSPTGEWHGARHYTTCPYCGKDVQTNKSILGGLHICASVCDRAGKHIDVVTRRRGLLRKRHTERYCKSCHTVIYEQTGWYKPLFRMSAFRKSPFRR